MSLTFSITCAFARTVDGVRFVPPSSVPSDHRLWCELRGHLWRDRRRRMHFLRIQVRSWGDGFATDVISRELLRPEHWRLLDDCSGFGAAAGFLDRCMQAEKLK